MTSKEEEQLAVAFSIWREIRPDLSQIKSLVTKRPLLAKEYARKLIVVISSIERLLEKKIGLDNQEKSNARAILSEAAKMYTLIPPDFLKQI